VLHGAEIISGPKIASPDEPQYGPVFTAAVMRRSSMSEPQTLLTGRARNVVTWGDHVGDDEYAQAPDVNN
jgi:hypothetical protein